MKYIKQYKLYENIKKTISIQNIEDCFMDLTDNDFLINVGFPEGGLKYGYVSITKTPTCDVNNKTWYKPFAIIDIRETLLFAIPYLQEKYGLITKNFRDASMYDRHIYKDFDEFNTSSEIYLMYEMSWEFYVINSKGVIKNK